MKQKMIALKPFRYATRALLAGDPFEASRRDAKVLEAVGRAQRYVPAPEPAKPAPKPKAVEPEDDLDELRAQAEKLGIEVDNRWRAKRLNDEIAAAKSSGRD